MKLIMTLLVRDEADIIEANLSYHYAQGVDFVIATDNLSVDETPKILKKYQQKGLLHYIYEAEDNYAQNRWVTRMARMACIEYGADWVINNDADEFWWPEQGNLKQYLSLLPAEITAVASQRTNFLPRSLSLEGFFADIMTVREVNSFNALGKPLPPKVCHRAYPDIEVAQGNHSVYRNGERIKTLDAPITILHFPMRSYYQFANKIDKGGAAYSRNNELPPNIGIRWRKWHEMLQAGALEDYYKTQLPDEKEIEKGILEGRYVLDERLKNFFKKIRFNKGI